jgi:hypothetical protein
MRDFINDNTTEVRGKTASVEALRRAYCKERGPIRRAEFRQQVTEAGFEVVQIACGPALLLHRERRQP